MSEKLNLDIFNRNLDLVARAVQADEIFSFLTRQITIPASCVALIQGPSGQPAVHPAGTEIDKDHASELFFVRTTPFELEYSTSGLPSKDGHDFSASVQMTVRIAPERTELEAFRQNLLGSRREVRLSRLHQHCEEAVLSALSAFIQSRDAADLVTPDRWGEFDPVLAEHFKPVGFESGLVLGTDPRVVFESAAYAESQREARADAIRENRDKEEALRREAAAKARAEHLAEVGTMLEKVKEMAGDGGALDVAELIKTFDTTQRGQLYHGLMALHEPERRTEAILVVAGSELLRFDPAKTDAPKKRRKLPKDAGALRSVRVMNDEEQADVLVGARHGVHVIDREKHEVRTCLLKDRPEIRGGVNAAVRLGDAIYSTHSEVGLIRWSLDKLDSHELCLTEFTEGSRSVRDVQTDPAGRLWFAVDDLVVGWTPERADSQTAIQAPAEVTCLSVADGHITAGLRDGSIVRWLIGDEKRMETIRGASSGPIRSLSWLSGGGIPRLLVGDGRQHLDLLVLGDSYRGEYRCLHNLRWGFAAEDLIVGVNDRRDHLFLWRVDSPESPTKTIPVSRITGRSIQDVALL